MTHNQNNDTPYKVVTTCSSQSEANIIMTLLQSASIDCFFSPTSFTELYMGNVASIEPIEIRVRPEDEQKALEILESATEDSE